MKNNLIRKCNQFSSRRTSGEYEARTLVRNEIRIPKFDDEMNLIAKAYQSYFLILLTNYAKILINIKNNAINSSLFTHHSAGYEYIFTI